MIAIFLFWISITWIFYASLGYLAILAIISRFVRRPVKKAAITPSVSFLIAAYNEERVIARKLENTLALDYPREKLEIIVMSDASTDRTDEIVKGFQTRGVKLHAIPESGGKPRAINLTVPQTSGEIILISDADSDYQADALRLLVRNFADTKVGSVTGEEVRLADAAGQGLGENYYNRLDNLIKRLEGQIGSMVMVNGGFTAIRRQLYPFVDPNINFDLVWAPLLKLGGYRTAYEPEAISTEIYPLDSSGDFRRRQRTVLQAFYSYLSVPQALNPFRTGWYALELISHRFMRWFVIPWLLVALIANILIAHVSLMYFIILVLQVLCYTCALIGWGLNHWGLKVKLFYIPYYFLYIHLAAFIAVLQAIAGRRMASWSPTQRSNSSTTIPG